MNRFLAWLIFVGVAGCAPSNKLPPMVPVRGVVTLDGKPLGAGQVVLHPEVESKAGLSASTIESDGVFEIYTQGHEGAPLGKYKVAVTPLMVPGGPMANPGFAPKYSDQKNTPLQIEVVNSPKPNAYDLKLTKK